MKNLLSHKNEIVAGLGALTAFMIFLPALVLRYTTQAYSGIQVAFGTDIETLGLFSNGALQLNIFIVLAYILPLIAGLLMLFFHHGEKVASVLFFIGLILLLTIPDRANIFIATEGVTIGYPVAWQFSYGLSLAIFFTVTGFGISLYETIQNVKHHKPNEKSLD